MARTCRVLHAVRAQNVAHGYGAQTPELPVPTVAARPIPDQQTNDCSGNLVETGSPPLNGPPPRATTEHMEVHLTPETEKKLKDLSEQSGRGTDDLVEDAMVGYFDEVLHVREMLDSRYDDLKSGRVKPIPVDEVEAHFRDKSAAARRPRSGS
jgi:hypothetical protein